MPEEPKPTDNRFWKLGGRVRKTVLVVFLSLLIESLRPHAMPFYAAIAGIICVRKDTRESWDVAFNRELATVVGGVIGMGFLILENAFGGFQGILRIALISLALIPIISLSVRISRSKATFLMCGVFLSVAISHPGDNYAAAMFSLYRVLDTTIGIVVALLVNTIPGEIARRLKHQRRDADPGEGIGPGDYAAADEVAAGGGDDGGGEEG